MPIHQGRQRRTGRCRFGDPYSTDSKGVLSGGMKTSSPRVARRAEKFSLEQPAVPSVIVIRFRSDEMVTKIIECAAVAVLLAAGLLWPYAAQQPLLFSVIVCGGSLLAVSHALRAQKRFMAWEFLGVALLFNPL